MPKSKTPSYFEVGPHKVKITFKEYLADDHRGLSDFANGTVAVSALGDRGPITASALPQGAR